MNHLNYRESHKTKVLKLIWICLFFISIINVNGMEDNALFKEVLESQDKAKGQSVLLDPQNIFELLSNEPESFQQ